MPTIPTFVSKRELTTEPGAVPVSAEAYGIKGDQGKILQTVGETLSKVGAKFQEIQDVNEFTQGQITSAKMLSNARIKAENNPDIFNAEKTFNEDIAKIPDAVISKIGNQLVRNKFLADFEMDKLNTTNRVSDTIRKKKLDDTVVKATDYIDAMTENYYNAEDPIEKQIYLNAMKNKLNDLVVAGWDRSKVSEYWKKKTIELNTESVLRDADVDPDNTLAEVKKGKEGRYPDLTTDERRDISVKIIAEGRRIKAIEKEARGDLYEDLSLKVMTGQASEKMIDDAMESYKLDPATGLTSAQGVSLKRALYVDITKRIGAKEYAKHKKAIDFVFSTSQQDKVKGYEAILEAYEDGLTKDESAFLSKILQTKKDVLFANKAAAGKKMLEQVFGTRPKDVAFETKTLLEYARRIANGTDPEQAAKETTLDIIKQDHPAVILDPDLAGVFSPSKGYTIIPKVKQEKK